MPGFAARLDLKMRGGGSAHGPDFHHLAHRTRFPDHWCCWRETGGGGDLPVARGSLVVDQHLGEQSNLVQPPHEGDRQGSSRQVQLVEAWAVRGGS